MTVHISFLLLITSVATSFADNTSAEIKDLEKYLAKYTSKVSSSALIDQLEKYIPSEKRVVLWKQAIEDLGHRTYSKRKAASERLNRSGPAALPLLEKALQSKDLEVRTRAKGCISRIQNHYGLPLVPTFRLLLLRKAKGAMEIFRDLLPYLEISEFENLLFMLEATCEKHPNCMKFLSSEIRSKYSFGRLLAGFALGASNQAQTRKSVYPLLKDPSSRVRLETAIALLSQGEERAMTPLIRLFSVLKSDRLLYRAQTAFVSAVGSKGVQLYALPLSKLKERDFQESIQRWWNRSKQKFTLRAFRRKRGYLLLSAHEPESWVGAINSRGQFVWKVKQTNYPNTAQMLPTGTVLVAERLDRRAVEYTLGGKVIWEYQHSNEVICAQRLPNGNTLVVDWYKILEVDRKKRILRKLYVSARQATVLPNGKLLLVTSQGAIERYDSEWKQELSFNAPNGLEAYYWASVESLGADRFLVTMGQNGKIYEMDSKGKVYWKYETSKAVSAATLPNGNILISCFEDRKVIEVNRKGKIVRNYSLGKKIFNAHPF